METLMPINKL